MKSANGNKTQFYPRRISNYGYRIFWPGVETPHTSGLLDSWPLDPSNPRCIDKNSHVHNFVSKWPFIDFNSLIEMDVADLCNALQCLSILYTALQCSAMLVNALQCSAMLVNALQYLSMLCNALEGSYMHCNALQCSSMLVNALQFTAMLRNALMLCNALQCFAMLFNTL